MHRGKLGSHDRHQPQGCLALHEVRDPPDAQARWRSYRQHGINSRTGRLRGIACLLCIQGWCHTTHARGGVGLRQSRDSRECCMPWRHSHADGRASSGYGSRGGPHRYGANRQDGQARRGCRSCRVVVFGRCVVCHWQCDASGRWLGRTVIGGCAPAGQPSALRVLHSVSELESPSHGSQVPPQRPRPVAGSQFENGAEFPIRARECRLMNRREFLTAIGSAALLPVLPRPLLASTTFSRRRPSDAAWPSSAAWKHLHEQVGGNLISVDFPLSVAKTDPNGAAAEALWKNLKNPYFIGETPGLTETTGWVDAWATKPSVYAVAARNAQDIAAAVNFARGNDLRLVVKGGGHSYQGTSNAPESLLIWTRHMHDIEMHTAFVPEGCEGTLQPQPAVTMGSGTIGIQAYDAVTTKGGKYVQGGGCLTVGLAGLIQGGGFGSFSKHYGTAAG